MLKYWKEHNFISELDEIEAIGFRIPYAGFKFLSPVFYSPEVRESIVTYAEKFIPLHTPPFLATLDGFIEYLPNVPKIVGSRYRLFTQIFLKLISNFQLIKNEQLNITLKNLATMA